MGLDLLRGKVGAMVAVLFTSSVALGMQVLVMPLYLQSLGVPPAVIGLVLGTFGAALVVFEFTWGWWSDHIGVGVPLIIARSGFAVVMFGYGFVTAVPGFILLQFLSGAFSCAMGPLPLSYLSHVIDPKRRGEAIALAQVPGPIGTGVGALVGGFVVEALGYRYTLIIAAGVASLSAVLAFVTFRDVRLHHAPSTAADQPPKQRTQASTWLVPLAVIGLFGTLALMGSSGERGFLPILARSRGLRPSEIGLLLTVLTILNAALMVPMGRLSDRIGRKPVILGGIALGAAALAAYAYANGTASLLIVVCLRAVALSATVPIAIALLSVVTPPQVRGRVMGYYGSLEDVGLAIGPAISGVVWSTWGIGQAFLVMAAFSLAGLVTAWLLIREPQWLRAMRLSTA